MSKEQYLRMCEQMKQEPDWEKCPDDWEDFPDIIVESVNIYHSMGDRIYGDVGYIGKDYTNYKHFLELYGIEEHQKPFVSEVILTMESRAIEKAQRKLKAEYDKIKRK
tara:strand:- start:62 stop:385 length:324 start_codon:yes stop_codon:yes gene_type:complete